MRTIKVSTGRDIARKIYGKQTVCEHCGQSPVRIDIHHKDRNPLNNDRSNILFLCRKCHMTEDGRIEIIRKLNKAAGSNNGNAILNESKVREIRRLWSDGKKIFELADLYSVSQYTIQNVIYRRNWNHI